MNPLEIPPDATLFRSAGKDYYLYLGALELRALQRLWGVTQAADDDDEKWKAKQIAYMRRLHGETFEDKFDILRIALSRYAEGNGLNIYDERAVAEVLDRIEAKDGGPADRAGRIARIMALHQQFFADCFGGDESGPKAQATTSPTNSEPASSNQNGS